PVPAARSAMHAPPPKTAGRPARPSRGSPSVLIPHAKRGDERFLRDADAPVLAHLRLAFFLLIQEFTLATCVAAVAFGGHILAHRADCLARDHLAADRRLDRDLEQ